jgi:hypothetical protein
MFAPLPFFMISPLFDYGMLQATFFVAMFHLALKLAVGTANVQAMKGCGVNSRRESSAIVCPLVLRNAVTSDGQISTHNI